MTTKPRGPNGSVRGVPAEKATAVLTKVVESVAEGGLEFQRKDAGDALEELGFTDDLKSGFLFSLQRTVPGIKNIGFGRYRLPEDWDLAVRHRLWKFRPQPLDVLDAIGLHEILDNADDLPDGLARLRQRLGVELGLLD